MISETVVCMILEFCNSLTSGRTGSSIPTTATQTRLLMISASLSHSGSGSLGRSRYATQIVRRPSHAIGSITFFTISSRSRGPKGRAEPLWDKMEEHLRGARNHTGLFRDGNMAVIQSSFSRYYSNLAWITVFRIKRVKDHVKINVNM